MKPIFPSNHNESVFWHMLSDTAKNALAVCYDEELPSLYFNPNPVPRRPLRPVVFEEWEIQPWGIRRGT